ncbi:MAG: serine hydrolase domain-containing protein [Pseudomonadota bacterium]
MTPEAFDSLLHAVADKWSVPGAQLCMSSTYETRFSATGIANAGDGSKLTHHTRFQLGSTTKPMLAFIAHLLAEDGKIDLDEPIDRLLPPTIRPANNVFSEVTCRHLMSHQSGLCGDVFYDLGDDFMAEQRLVTEAAQRPKVHDPGLDVSYCNFGYVLLGQVLEHVSGEHWSKLLDARLKCLIGSDTLKPWPGDHPTHAAIGHSDGLPVSRRSLPASNAAAGTTLIGTAFDLSQFGLLALQSLRGDGPLTKASAKNMVTPTRRLAPNERGLGFGSGFMVYQDAPFVFGHDGLTIGQQAYLRVFEDSGLSLAFLGNGGDMRSAAADLFQHLASETGTALQPPAYPKDKNTDVSDGHYARQNASIEIVSTSSGQHLTIVNHEHWAADLYGQREGPFELVKLPNGGIGFFKAASATPFRVHIQRSTAYLGMRRYNRVEDMA